MIRFAINNIRNKSNVMRADLTEADFFSEYAHQILSQAGLQKIETVFGRQNIGLVMIHLLKFYDIVGNHGEETGLRLLALFKNEIQLNFEKYFYDYRLLIIEPVGLQQIVLCFDFPNDANPGLTTSVRTFGSSLERQLNRKASELTAGAYIQLKIGYSQIDQDQGEGFYKVVFKAFCEAQRNMEESPPASETKDAVEATDSRGMAPVEINSAPPKEVRPSMVNNIQKISLNGFQKSDPLREMLTPPTLYTSAETLVRDVKDMFKDKPPMTSLVVLENRKPVGLLMHYELGRKLSSRYGVSLYYHRPVSCIMDGKPLIAEVDHSVEELAKFAMNREDDKIYDDIIVTENGVFIGTISIRTMLNYIAELQVQIAMGANPLTGLPGNVAIEQEISSRAAKNMRSSLIYIDLDNFKVYNDVYGFENGDRVILFTADTIKRAVEITGGPNDFIGHVGGDDFVIISEQSHSQRICQSISEIFEQEIQKLYTEEDRQCGYIVGKGRDGVRREYPFVSVSIGIIDCEFKTPFTMDDLSRRVAEIKKYAKSISGNSYVKDRRAPLGSAESSSSKIR